MDQETLQLVKRLEKHPHIRARMEAILDVAENNADGFPSADAAELQLIQEVRKLGAESLQTWAEYREQSAVGTYKEKHSTVGHGKKK